jgi:hypothetical protein
MSIYFPGGGGVKGDRLARKAELTTLPPSVEPIV